MSHLQRWTARSTCLAVLGVAGLTGCLLVTPPPAEPIVVELYNPTTLDVRPNFHTSSVATDAAGLFVAENLRTDFTDRVFPELRPGERIELTFNCDELRSLGVFQPVLFNSTTLAVTVSNESVALFRENNFDCGDRVRLVFFTEGAVFRVRVE